MPGPRLSPLRSVGERAPVPVKDAAAGWIGAWLIGAVVASAVVGFSGHDSLAAAGPGWLTASAVLQWIPLVLMVWALGRRHGTGDLGRDFGLSFRAVDLVGMPLGVLTQLVALPLVYWPLEQAWPGTFSRARLEERATDLWDSAQGGAVALLVIVVVVGAPVVEELVYRGLLQGALTRWLHDAIGLVVAAAWFALIHFEPVEYPGLFVAGLVFGICAVRTDRIGMSILAHLAFNATGLAVVAAG